MPIPERLDSPVKGEPCALVDENINKAGKSFLYYAYFNKDGDLLYYAEFLRDASPEDISDLINDFADELLETNPNNLSDYELRKKVELLREQADTVPGLWA